MESTYQEIKPCEGIFQIDHCLDGCYESKLKSNERAFIGKGDCSVVDLGKVPFESSKIPMKRYVGLTIFIDVNSAQKSIDNYFPFTKINIKEMMNMLCKDGPSLIIKSRKEINHILNELYTVSEDIRISYSIIKIIELLLFLSLVKTEDIKKIPTFSSPIYDATQECYKALVENPFDKYSIPELAKQYAISESSLKRCFIHLTGQSIGSFKKNTCLEESARLLIDKPHITVGEVADFAGYLHPGKFSSAFKTYFGVSPQQYRKNKLS
ncbi:helix-turn-helix transcriptional regulator [Streptococcus iniae]